MTKQELEQKIKKILSKDDRFKGAVIKIKFIDKKVYLNENEK
ncbi:MAG: hypothetical protein U9R39_02075 [Campylobacterota bacterium]|nr:hypothetical protein [Campylobacterota bacterium]